MNLWTKLFGGRGDSGGPSANRTGGNCPKCGKSLKTSPVPGEEGMFRQCTQCGALYHRECAAGGGKTVTCVKCGGTSWRWEFSK